MAGSGPPAGGNAPPGHSRSAVGLEGPPAAVTWELGQGEREREMGGQGEEREREREREMRPGLADPGARRHMVLRQLDGLCGFGRRIAGWPALGLRSPGGSRQAAVGLPPAPPPSAGGSGAPATGCAPSHTPPLSSQIGPRRPPGRLGVPSSSAGRGRSMGLQRGFPPGLASSGWSAGLHPAPGPRAGTDLPAPASCPRALGAAPDEDQRAIGLAPQVGWGWRVA